MRNPMGGKEFARQLAAYRNNPYQQSKTQILQRAAWELRNFTPTELQRWIELEYHPVKYDPAEVSRAIASQVKAGNAQQVRLKDGDDKRARRYVYTGDEPPKVLEDIPIPMVEFRPGGIEIERNPFTGDVLRVIRLLNSVRNHQVHYEVLWKRGDDKKVLDDF